MTENNRVSAREWHDPDDAPEWTDAMFDRAAFEAGDAVKPASQTFGASRTARASSSAVSEVGKKKKKT